MYCKSRTFNEVVRALNYILHNHHRQNDTQNHILTDKKSVISKWNLF